MSEKPTDIVGHKTFHDANGYRHEPLTRAEADAILERVSIANLRRRELMPDEETAIGIFFEAWLRLKEFGWKEAMYCPKDRTVFHAIEAGSTGIHRCIYEGEWPKGGYWILEDGDMSPSTPVLFRKIGEQATHAP